MSEANINGMDLKQLRNEVQLLRDELAIMKRKYEDIIYNLDDDNFSSRFVKEKGDMRTAIEVNAEGIKTKVSNTEFESTKTQLANKIESEVKTLDNTLSSKITQTASEINATVSSNYSSLSSSISSVRQTANSISSKVTNLETFKTSVFTQTEYGFTLDGEQTAFTGVIYLTDADGNKCFSFFFNDTQFGREEIMLHNCDGKITRPLVLGDWTDYSSFKHNVYIGQTADGNEVATHRWVLENGGGGGTAIAVFK